MLLSPLVRVGAYYALPAMQNRTGLMLHTRLDTLITGCMLALLIDMTLWTRVRQVAGHWAAASAGFLFLLTTDPWAEQRWRGSYLLTVGDSLRNLAIAAILLYVIFHHESPVGRMLNSKLLRHLGVISYSLYLWQQLFIGPRALSFPLTILCIAGCAELSYFLVEQPSFWLRDRLEERLSARGEFPGKAAEIRAG